MARLDKSCETRVPDEIMKTMFPLGHRQNGFIATCALWLTIHSYILLVPINQDMLNKLLNEQQDTLA